MRSATFEAVRDVLCEQLGVDPAEVTPTAQLTDDLGTDSLDEIELVMAFEEAYDIEISDDDAYKIRTVADIVDYLKLATAGAR